MKNDELLKRIKELLQAQPQLLEKTVFCKPLEFTQKEISRMPKTFKKEFRTQGATAHVRKRTDDRYRCSYEIRYRRNGYNISVSARTLEDAKIRFIRKLKEIEDNPSSATKTRYPTEFSAFATYWFENLHKRRVAKATSEHTKTRLSKYIYPSLKGLSLSQITPEQIQTLLDNINAMGYGKTKDECHSIINQIFKTAQKLALVKINPIDLVINKQHERKNGSALSIAEQKLLLEQTKGTRYETTFAIAMFAGLRPNELATVQIKDRMLIAVNSKRKGGKVEYKKIPINPMLAPFLDGVKDLNLVRPHCLRLRLIEILPNHKLYDLRTTFYTYCKICGVNESALKEMVGHSAGKLAQAYTDLPDEFLIKEAQKLSWW